MKTLMEQEINEVGQVLGNLISKYIVNYCITVNFPSKFSRIKFIASGSSHNCAGIAEKFFRDIAECDGSCEFSSEFLSNRNPRIDKDTLYFFISQSGETFDTSTALETVKKAGGMTFALTNTEECKMNSLADTYLNVEAGKEASIAATKSFTACVFGAWLCALKLAQSKSIDISSHIEGIEKLPSAIEDIIANPKQFEVVANFLAKHKSLPIVGYDYYYAAAKECALKTKETTFIDANAYALGEFMHGHMALLTQKNAIIEIFTDDINPFEKKSLDKIKQKYNPKTIVITDYKGYMENDYEIIFPKFKTMIFKVLALITIFQMLALKTAIKLKRNVDTPEGLDKVVM